MLTKAMIELSLIKSDISSTIFFLDSEIFTASFGVICFLSPRSWCLLAGCRTLSEHWTSSEHWLLIWAFSLLIYSLHCLQLPAFGFCFLLLQPFLLLGFLFP